jgi:hypothetical protein
MSARRTRLQRSVAVVLCIALFFLLAVSLFGSLASTAALVPFVLFLLLLVELLPSNKQAGPHLSLSLLSLDNSRAPPTV